MVREKKERSAAHNATQAAWRPVSELHKAIGYEEKARNVL